MKFAIVKNGTNLLRDEIVDHLVERCRARGYDLVNQDEEDINFIFNLTTIDNPRSFRRRSKSIFVISFIADPIPCDKIKSNCYTTLIRTLSNLLVYAIPKKKLDNSADGKIEIHFTTPEAGFYNIPFNTDYVLDKINPIISAHFATDNQFSTDLPERFWQTSPVVEELKLYGKQLNSMGVLPTPFPLRQFLSEEDMRHIYKIYGITGASYGNLSARESIPELGESTFWMTGRGVNKANISKVGNDVLLVKGFDFENRTAIISMPPVYNLKARVSVDAVEHSLIYQAFPEVGAIIHAHAWIRDVVCTRQNYPCGTVELAHEVLEMLKQSDDPAKAEVGLKNHGLTITGKNLQEIFDRIRGRLVTEVEMFS